MELGHLKHFYYVAKYGGFTKASKKLYVQQPSISKTVALLEDQLGVKLLNREKRKTTLTDIGQEIYAKCDLIFKTVEDIENIASDGKFECSGPLKFCASEPISAHFVPGILKEFLSEYPQVQPACFTSFSSDLFNKIEDGEFEFGLFFHTPEMAKYAHKLELEEIASIPYDLVIKASEHKNLDVIRSFIGSREVDDVTTKKYPTISKMNKDYKNVKITISSNSLTSHKEMVLQGLGVSILPSIMVEKEIKAKELKRLYPKGTFHFPLKLVTKKNHFLSRNAQAWIKCLKEQLSII
ncbi:LysR family transcriptional regulator [Halobacteriovorax sp. RZ-1]|uniref:LysR family transcriptional regulator n=1 Tax=unclassified Halobacteriovorax TaxID=2639665 RepID=UPI00371303BE